MFNFSIRYILLILLITTVSVPLLFSCSANPEVNQEAVPNVPSAPIEDELVESTTTVDVNTPVARDVLFDYLRAQSQLGAAMYKEAIGSYSVVLKIHPDLYLAYHGRALAYYKENMVDKAIEDFNKAISLKPDYAVALRNRGIVFANEGLFNQACSDLNKALEIYKNKLTMNEFVLGKEKVNSDMLETLSQLKSCR